MKKIMILILALVGMLTGAKAQQDMPLPLDPAVREGVLPNGLTYYIRHNEWPEKRCDFYIAQKVGSMQEEDHQRGLAHFLEHMCFNGTTHFPGSALKEYLERIGVKFGENLNAYTSYEETVYNINNVNVETVGAVDSCLLILHDWSHDLLLEDKEIDKERGVINEEWRMRRTAMQRMQEKAFAEIYAGCRYAERSPIGTMDIVMNFPYEAIRSYYRTWYRPDLQGLVIVGDVNVDEVEGKIKDMFADIAPAAADAPQLELCQIPASEETIVSIQADKEQPTSVGLMMFQMDPMPRQVRGSMSGLFMNYMFSAIEHMFYERISDILHQPNAPFLYAGAGYGPYILAKSKDAVTIQVVLKDGEYASGLAAAYREFLRAQRGGFTAGEYERFKTEYLSQLEAAFNARDKVENTSYVKEYVRHFIDNDPATGIEFEYKTMQQFVPRIPLEAINQVLAQLPITGRSIVFFMPEKEGVALPTKEDVLAAISAVESEEIAALTEEVNNDPLVPEFQSNAKVKSIKDDAFGAKLITLSNGIRIHALPTDYSPNNISFRAVSWGGTSLYSDDEYPVADNAPLVEEGGFGNFSATELQKKMAGKQANVSSKVGTQTESLDGSCVKKDLETMLQMVYLTFTSLRRDDDAINAMKERIVQSLKNQDLNPMTALQDSIASVFYGKHKRAIRLNAEVAEGLSYDRMMEIYKERFANAKDFQFYLVGDFNVDSIAPLLTHYLGALPVKGKAEKCKTISMRLAKGEKECIFEKEQDTPNATVIFQYHAPVKYDLRNNLLTSVLSQTMTMLYTETVREDEGGAYGIPVRASITDYPEAMANVMIQLPTAPEKVERMTEIIYAGAEKISTEGPTEEMLQKIREYMTRSHAESLKDNGYWMRQLVNRTFDGYDFVTDFDKTLQSITVEEVRDFAAKIFKSGNRLVVGMKTPVK